MQRQPRPQMQPSQAAKAAPAKAADATPRPRPRRPRRRQPPKNYSRGEGQKPVTQAYKDNWNAIFGDETKKKKKR